MGTIVGVNGKPLAKVDPRQIGVEDLIDMQEITKGQGTGLAPNDLLTVIIFELNRTKQYAIKLGNVLNEKNEQISELEKRLDSRKSCSCDLTDVVENSRLGG